MLRYTDSWPPLSLAVAHTTPPSGYRESRLRAARVSRLRKLRYAEPRLLEIPCHVSLLMDGPDRPSLFGVFDTNVPMSSEFPIFRWGQTSMVLDGCHLSHRWTALIVSKFPLWISQPLAHRVSDSPRMTDTCPVVWTVLILSGNRVSRFLDATVLHP
jgi:hypothetical protein